MNQLSVKNLFGMDIVSSTLDDVVKTCVSEINNSKASAKVIVTPNLDHVVKLHKNLSNRLAYLKADLFLPDGFPLVWASKLCGNPLKSRICGADLLPEMLKVLNLQQQKKKIYIIGGFPGDESLIISKLTSIYPSVDFFIYSPSAKFTPSGSEAEEIVVNINLIEPDMVCVCLGFPKQEMWAIANRERLKTNLIVCVGAALDFILGKVKRAPHVWQKWNLEWLWRLFSDPQRLAKRYLVDSWMFIWIMILEIKVRKNK